MDAWKPNGMKVTIQARPIHPLYAFKLFVLPFVDEEDWIENGPIVPNKKGMRVREWAGLVLHALTLHDNTEKAIYVGQPHSMYGDGAVMRVNEGKREAVIVEQTLATYKAGQDLNAELERVISKKSNESRGKDYAENNHLIVFSNMNGDFDDKKLMEIVTRSSYNVVNIIGFSSKKVEGWANKYERHYLCYLFNKDFPERPIHHSAINETALRIESNTIDSHPDDSVIVTQVERRLQEYLERNRRKREKTARS